MPSETPVALAGAARGLCCCPSTLPHICTLLLKSINTLLTVVRLSDLPPMWSISGLYWLLQQIAVGLMAFNHSKTNKQTNF